MVELAATLDVPDLVLHCITDGRDTDPHGAAGYLAELERCCARRGVGRVASVAGRFYAMDRDRRWERTQAAYDLIVPAARAHGAAHSRGGDRRRVRPRGDGRVHRADNGRARRAASGRATASYA